MSRSNSRITGEITEDIAENMINQKYETATIDYKEKFPEDTGSWMELAKDVYGMANYGGGYIVIGIEDGTFKLKGLENSFHIDAQILTSKINKWINESVDISYYEHSKNINDQNKKFLIICIHGTVSKFLIPKCDGTYTTEYGQKKKAFSKGIVYTRENTSTVIASGEEYVKLFWAMLNRTATKTGGNEIPINALTILNDKTIPDSSEEKLWSNLFPVQEIPDYIHSATTNYQNPREIYQIINTKMRSLRRTNFSVPAFILSEKKIFSFSPINEYNPLTYCVNIVHDPIRTWDWLTYSERHNDLTKLLNYSLKNHCRRRNFIYDKKQNRYYIKYQRGKSFEIQWKPYKKSSIRKLITQKTNKENVIIYYEHFAAKMRFKILGKGIFLNIEPTRVLTADGVNPLDQKQNVQITTRKNSLYHNNHYLYDLKLILHILAGNKNTIYIGRKDSRITVDLRPLGDTVDFGIINDQYTKEDFLDSLQSEPLEYDIIKNDNEPFEVNPLTQTTLEESN